ncbi:MAG: beta-galactosidase trimerization domain-containing protein [Kiritimatiellae bacterium]|nr:beta-galactosidase trimerization domain-containing protein [Kiritimatiellia bacterium]
MNRRGFLELLSLAGISVAAPRSFSADSRVTNTRPFTVEGWAERPMRWANLTFVETDPPKVDLQWWFDLYRRAHFDAVVLSAGGAVAYYPTKVPLHHRSRWLGERDLFGEAVDGCRKLGMVVVARVDPHAVHQDFADAHPDYLAVDANGNKRRHFHSPDYWLTCALGPMNFEYMPKIIEEIVATYRVDGVFANRWPGSGMCYCEHCERLFREATGHAALPRMPKEAGPRPPMDWEINPRDPVWRDYAKWREERLFALWDLWDSVVRRHNPHARFIPNMGPDMRRVLDMVRFANRAVYLTADRQGRRTNEPVWVIGIAAKEFRAVLGRKPLGAGFAFGPQSQYRWIDSTHGPAEITAWFVDAVANGIRPSIGKTGATVADTRWVPTVEKLFGWHHANEPYLRNETPLARVGMVFSQKSHVLDGQWYTDSQLGMYQALLEARIPFEFVHDGLLEPERLQPFKLLVLPNITCLSDRQCAQLREFVRRGGSLLATYQTSLFDEDGRPRKDFGLADLFGVKMSARSSGPMNNSFMRLVRGPAGTPLHPLLQGFEGTERIVNTVHRVVVVPTAPLDSVPLTFIPPFPSLPMEELYPRVERTDTPLVFLRQFGNGRVVYFPGDIDRTFWELLIEDHARLLRNAFHWALNEPPVVTVTGPGLMDVTLWRQANSITVHMVNLGTAMTMRGYLREFIPLPPQTVHLRLPRGTTAKRVKLLVAGQTLPVQEDNGVLTVTVPKIDAHEVVAVDL